MMKHGKSWAALGVTAAAAAATLTAGGAAWASGPSGQAWPAAVSARLTAPPRGTVAACEAMMHGHPDMERLHHQLMHGSPGMAVRSREMMGGGAAGMMDTGPAAAP